MNAQEMRYGYVLPGTRKVPCLLIHGFCGTPAELGLLAKDLNGKGYEVHGMVVDSFGIDGEHIEKSSYKDWLKSALREYDALEKEFGQVYVVGLSMGALLTLAIGINRHPKAIVPLSTPIKIPNGTAGRFVKLIAPFVRYMKWAPNPLPKESEPYLINYTPGIPVKALPELMKLASYVGKNLNKISSPICAISGKKDNLTYPLKNFAILEKRLSSDVIELNLLSTSSHIVSLDENRQKTFDLTSRFLLSQDEK